MDKLSVRRKKSTNFFDVNRINVCSTLIGLLTLRDCIMFDVLAVTVVEDDDGDD